MSVLSKILASNTELCSDEEYLQIKIDSFNQLQGNLTGYDCKECKNKGYIALAKDGEEAFCECNCMAIRKSMWRIEKSGLKHLLAEYTFDKYKTGHELHKQAKHLALNFVTDHTGKWFFIGGQVGAGKTHLCTAIVNELLGKGMPAKYMLWRDEIVLLKAKVTDEAEYEKAIYQLKTVKVLYIDDFFKTESGKYPTTADINIAFELLNFRYNNHDLITIISSEKTMSELIDIDEATGSRIYQRTKEYCINIAPDKSKNYRLNNLY